MTPLLLSTDYRADRAVLKEAMLQRVRRLEAEAEDLRSEADGCEREADRLRREVLALSAPAGMSDVAADVRLALLSAPDEFISTARLRTEKHPMLETLRRVLLLLDEVIDECDERAEAEKLRRACKPLETLLEQRERAAYAAAMARRAA